MSINDTAHIIKDIVREFPMQVRVFYGRNAEQQAQLVDVGFDENDQFNGLFLVNFNRTVTAEDGLTAIGDGMSVISTHEDKYWCPADCLEFIDGFGSAGRDWGGM